MNYLQNFSEALKLKYYFHHYNHWQHSMKVSKLLQYHFLFQILIYQVANHLILRLGGYIESFYSDTILKQNNLRNTY